MNQPAILWRNSSYVKRQLSSLLASILLITALPAGAPLADVPELPKDAEKLSANQIYQALNRKRVTVVLHSASGDGGGILNFDFDGGQIWGYVRRRLKSGEVSWLAYRRQLWFDDDHFCHGYDSRKVSRRSWDCRSVYRVSDGTMQTSLQGAVTSHYTIQDLQRPENPIDHREATLGEILSFTGGHQVGTINFGYREPEAELIVFDWNSQTTKVMMTTRVEEAWRKEVRKFHVKDNRLCSAFGGVAATRCVTFKIIGDTFVALSSEGEVLVVGSR